jgi:hypothetical protein
MNGYYVTWSDEEDFCYMLFDTKAEAEVFTENRKKMAHIQDVSLVSVDVVEDDLDYADDLDPWHKDYLA